MPKLPIVSGKETVKALSKIGFSVIKQEGSHIKLNLPIKGHQRLMI